MAGAGDDSDIRSGIIKRSNVYLRNNNDNLDSSRKEGGSIYEIFHSFAGGV